MHYEQVLTLSAFDRFANDQLYLAPFSRRLGELYEQKGDQQTTESTGLSAIPARDTPWVMNAGTPKAHIMFVPSM